MSSQRLSPASERVDRTVGRRVPSRFPSSASARRGHRLAIVRSACAAALVVVGGNALSLPGRQMIGHYDFGYTIRGDRPARPAQVFDDGAGKIYFQVRPGQTMPAVFVGKEPGLLVTQPEGQYFTARTGANEFTLAIGGARAVVRRGDAALGAETVSDGVDGGRLLASAAAGLPAGVDFGESEPSSDLAPGEAAASARLFPDRRGVSHEQPVVFPAGSSTLKAEVRDALSALVVRIGRDTPIVVEGRNDAGGQDALSRLRAGALRNALLARGVATANIGLRTGASASGPSGGGERRSIASSIRWVSAAVPAQGTVEGHDAVGTPALFDISPADHDIAVSLRRWAQAAGYEVVWDVRWVAPVNGALRVDAPSFLDAVRQVVTGLRAQGYPVQAQAYANHVVRFSATP